MSEGVGREARCCSIWAKSNFGERAGQVIRPTRLVFAFDFDAIITLLHLPCYFYIVYDSESALDHLLHLPKNKCPLSLAVILRTWLLRLQ